ncbi:MAG: class I poly(R)-hydroxyalkanoic acid synthase [Burkholderiaceae bacterium]
MGKAAAAAAEAGDNQMALDLMGEMAREITRQLAANPVPNQPPPAPTQQAAAPAFEMPALSLDPADLIKLQKDYLERAGNLLSAGPGAVPLKDRRFQSESWREGMFAWNAALYELNAEFMARFAQSATGDAKSVERVRFATQQWIDASSPSNFLVSNPEAQKEVVESGGQSLVAGMSNLLEDFKQGHISQSDESAFQVGKELAVTPGSVVFQNDLMQLIQYAPTTEKVGVTPMLMVPPCINKFYILDLQPQNSLVAHLVSQGHTVFMVSWKNPQAELGHITWDDYLEQGPIEAIRVVQEICGTEVINTLGFCVGGTILSSALAVLAARGERPACSVTLLTTLLDFEEPGILDIFIDEAAVAMREATLGQGGILPGAELAQTFSALRPNDLIWNYVVKNYLHGKAPPAFDLLYWNGDSTNLPGPMFVYYLRHMYLQNDLCVPGRLKCLGESVDLASINLPTYIYGSKDDHIVPWKSAFASTNLLTGDLRFVLGASGHIAGVINPPAKNKRNYWVNDSIGPEADDWFESATEVAGSWWPDWCQWLETFRDGSVSARVEGGSGYRVIEPAPGSYVKEKA